MGKRLYHRMGMIFMCIMLVLQAFGVSKTVNADTTLCQTSSDFNTDGDVDGADLQLLAAALANETAADDALADLVELFGTDDVDSVLSLLQPKLAMMVASDTDKLKMAWTPGSDGLTPSDEIIYDIYLDTEESFIPDASNLVDTLIGNNQIEITGLDNDTRYYGKVVAIYADKTSCASNCLQTKTYPFSIQEDSETDVFEAEDLGLGEHTTTDGITYIYSGGTAPPVDSILVSEDVSGGMTIRRVESTVSSGDQITVVTGDASLVDVLDRGAEFTAFKLFDVSEEAEAMSSGSTVAAVAKSSKSKDGSSYRRIDWQNNLLSAEQTTYACDSDTLSVKSQNGSSVIKLYKSKGVSSEFEATLTAEFEPEIITEAEWGGLVLKELDSAHVGVKGILKLTAKAQYNFSASGEVSKDFKLWDRTWTAVYPVGPLQVLQDITLSMNVEASASALAAIEAMAQAQLIETVELGATYDGADWTPYISYDKQTSLTASLDIKGEANAQIRLIPKIEVGFYKVSSASFTIEPIAGSSLTFEETTSNLSFLAAHPERLVELTAFDASLGMEANVAASLSALGQNWDILSSTCVLGTGDCLYTFDGLELFSIPELDLTKDGMTLQLKVSNGTNNRFRSGSVEWEVFPDDATIVQGSCSQSGSTTTCSATLIPGEEEEYTVFASGHGVLGEMGRQFEQITLVSSPCGAYVAPDVWKQFDCYNLAAIGKTTLDHPFTPSWRLIGGYWQWGQKGPDSSLWYDTNTAHFAHGPTGEGAFYANDDQIYVWNSIWADSGAWSDAEKTANDPCPSGYRMPTIEQWEGVKDNNTQTTVGTWSDDATNYSSGTFFGDDLMLPATGYRRIRKPGSLIGRGYYGFYWSSTENPDDRRMAWCFITQKDGYAYTDEKYRTSGGSVRCIEE